MVIHGENLLFLKSNHELLYFALLFAIQINSETGLSFFVDHLRAFHMSIRPVHDK